MLSNQILKFPSVHSHISALSPAFRFKYRIIQLDASLLLGLGTADRRPLSKENGLAQEDLLIIINKIDPKFNPGLKTAVQVYLLKSSLK